MPSISASIYIVEDEAIIAMELTDQLRLLGYEVCGTVARGEKALVAMETRVPDLVLMDINLAGKLDGIETARRLREQHDVPVVFLTAFSDSSFVKRALKTSPFGYLVKPFEPRELNATLQMALAQHRLEKNLRESNEKLDEKVRRRTRELEASNRELESFAYTVAHDLRTPLRAIDGWSLALTEDLSDRLDDDSRQHLSLLRNEAQRMDRLIDGLLTLARASSLKLNYETVNLTQIAKIAVDLLRAVESLPHAEVELMPDLTAECDNRLIGSVVNELIANAWKFTRPGVPAKIIFGRRETDRGWAFFVHDNGIGFDPVHAENVFKPFHRLNKEGAYPGNGIGLAIAHRIIERHHGSIWFESRPGTGSTFYFTLSPPSPSHT